MDQEKLEIVLHHPGKLFSRFIDQLNKDLNHPLLQKHEKDAAILVNQLEGYLFQNVARIPEILYRADVNEKAVLQIPPGENYFRDMARLIIIREAEKVVFRSRY